MIMPKIYVLSPDENWICDRFVKEWSEFYPHCVNRPEDADIIWLLADWCWKKINPTLLKNKKVVVTVHHIVPEKFNQTEVDNFLLRDQFVDAYHVPCLKTKDQISKLTNKEIISFPFWVNGNLWFNIGDKQNIRRNYGIDDNIFLIGSFQRDTEGHDLKSPKLEKGPDIFCDVVEFYDKKNKKLGIETRVLLAGWRRQYVMRRLEEKSINYYYAELPDFKTINNFYNLIDLYVVGARYEGGPQSILECAATKTPVISTNVGIASEILNPKSIYKHNLDDIENVETDVDSAFDSVSKFMMPHGFNNFINFFKRI